MNYFRKTLYLRCLIRSNSHSNYGYYIFVFLFMLIFKSQSTNFIGNTEKEVFTKEKRFKKCK